MPRPRFVNCPQHHAAREIRCDSRRISGRNFRKISAGRTFWVRNLAETRCTPRGAARPQSLEVPKLCAERQHAVAREIRCDSRRISDRNFEKFSRPRNFAIEIARDRAEIRCPLRAAARPQPLEVPKLCAERRHAVAREIRCDSRRLSDRNFRNFFAAAKFCDRNRARSRPNSLCLTW